MDFIFRPGAVEQAKLKSAQQGAPVYMYMFAWGIARDGRNTPQHALYGDSFCVQQCRAPCFDDRRRKGGTSAGGQDEQCVAELCRTGNPNTEGLPEWEPYTADKGATMIFDNDCGMKYNHDKELLEVVMTFPVRGF